MGFLSAIPVVGEVIERSLGIVDKYVKDKDQAERLKAELKQQIEDNSHEREIAQLKAQAGIIQSEAGGESPEQRKWRPHLMYLIMFLLVFNGVVVPLGEAIFQVDIPTLEAWNSIPVQLWQLLMIGVGGYIGGRSAEKVVRDWGKKR